jgi:hypothetical protein
MSIAEAIAATMALTLAIGIFAAVTIVTLIQTGYI